MSTDTNSDHAGRGSLPVESAAKLTVIAGGAEPTPTDAEQPQPTALADARAHAARELASEPLGLTA